MDSTYSRNKIFQSVWFVSSVYLGFMISNLASEVIIPQIYKETIDVANVILGSLTFFIYFWAAIETYLWLNQTTDKEISSTEMLFDFALVVLFVIATLAHALLYYSLKDSIDSRAVAFWGKSFSFIIFCWFLYNVIDFIKILIVDGNNDWKKLKKYIFHYLAFSLIFFGVSEYVIQKCIFSVNNSAIIISAIYIVYFITYLKVWWKDWHENELRFKNE